MSFVDYVGLITDLWGAQRLPEITDRYPSLTSKSHRTDNLGHLLSDYLFICPARFTARNLQSLGVTSYTYVFDHVWSFAKQAWGPKYSFCYNVTCHGSELPFIFGSAELNFTVTDEEENLAIEIQTAYANYAYTADPNQPYGLSGVWNDASQNDTYVFSTPSYSALGYDQSNCDFWDEVGYTYGGDKLKRMLAEYAARNRHLANAASKPQALHRLKTKAKIL